MGVDNLLAIMTQLALNLYGTQGMLLESHLTVVSVGHEYDCLLACNDAEQ